MKKLSHISYGTLIILVSNDLSLQQIEHDTLGLRDEVLD